MPAPLKATLLAGLVSMLVLSCTAVYHQEAADRQAYGAIDEKAPAVPGMTRDIRLERPEKPPLESYPVSTEEALFLGPLAAQEEGARIITLDQALAFDYNRDYQLQKERLYLEALSLTRDRYQYSPIFAATAQGTYDWDVENEFVRDAESLLNVATGETLVDEQINARSTIGSRLLLRGAGSAADETLMQAERDLLYQLRDGLVESDERRRA